MKRTLAFFLLTLCFNCVYAQYKVRFVVNEKTTNKHDSIYITGDFRKWDSTANPKFRLQGDENEKWIVLNLSRGNHAYKINRGSWFSVEKSFFGEEIPDHQITVNRDTTIQLNVVCWRDEVVYDKWQALARSKSDSEKIAIYTGLARVYAFFAEWYNPDSALHYTQLAVSSIENIRSTPQYKRPGPNSYPFQVILLKDLTATLVHSLGNYPRALEIRLDILKLSEKDPDMFHRLKAVRGIITEYSAMKDYARALNYSQKMQEILKMVPRGHEDYLNSVALANYSMAEAYYNLADIDSALYYAKGLYDIAVRENAASGLVYSSNILGDIYSKKGNSQLAFSFYRTAIPIAYKAYLFQFAARSQAGMAKLFQQSGRYDSGLVYARQAMTTLQNRVVDVQSWGEHADSYIAEVGPLIATLYESNHQMDSAYKYLRLAVDIKDSLFNIDKIRQFQNLSFNEATRQQQLLQEAKDARQRYETRVKYYALIAGLVVLLLLAFIQYRNNKHKQRDNELLQKQKQEIEITLGELKTAQNQLIQSEKMASLGQLTAGIAHEIKNPLNFVNNFSEVSIELANEMREELKAGKTKEAALLWESLVENLQKISFHGKRADSIIRGMLQHSRNSSGKKEAVDINDLTDEYLRLSFHGLRAKDKAFNSKIETNFDGKIGPVNLIPQEIGRVLLNLFTNAFYAVLQKKKQSAPGDPYEPCVAVSTHRFMLNGGPGISINVRDNGTGIPPDVMDKIFQPFFTTKPSGQGTGLGLSLSYDIVKAQGGDIKVKTVEGNGSEFIVELPAK